MGPQERATGCPHYALHQSYNHLHPMDPSPTCPMEPHSGQASPLQLISEKTQGLEWAVLWRHPNFQVPRTQACPVSARQSWKSNGRWVGILELSPYVSAVPVPALWLEYNGLTPFLLSVQRQRLRELLIRQQIQRNTLRQEKETAAAAAGVVGPPGTWGAEPSSPAFEQLSRGQTPFAGTQVGRAARVGGSRVLKVALPPLSPF